MDAAEDSIGVPAYPLLLIVVQGLPSIVQMHVSLQRKLVRDSMVRDDWKKNFSVILLMSTIPSMSLTRTLLYACSTSGILSLRTFW
jgi:hypothetical protein